MVLLLMCVALIAEAAYAAAGAVGAMRGEAFATMRGEAESRPLAIGADVFRGDRLRTGPNSFVTVVFGDKSALTIGSESELTVETFDLGTDTPGFTARIRNGVFRYFSGLIGEQAPESVAIHTPVASVGIRGTHFGGEVRGERTIIVLLPMPDDRASAVVVHNDFGRVVVDKAGYGTQVRDARSPPSPPRRMRLRSVEQLSRSVFRAPGF